MSKDLTRVVAGSTKTTWRQVQVLVDKGLDRGKSVLLDAGSLVVGTDPDCDLVLGDDSVSARHCEFSVQGNAILLRDLGSTNGVQVNGVPITEALPAVGAHITVGQSELTLTAAGQSDVVLSGANRFGALYGKSPVMRALFAQLEALGQSEAPLLIEGETGTGKDVTAETIHGASPRRDGPLVIFDCGAVAANLLEAELFGYEKGAFTGAEKARPGLAEAAHGGTLVLDEMGDLPIELQPKLLRLVERKEVRRVGSNTSTPVDVRIIASTHRSLRAEVKAGRFREDLYYRLSALRIRLPALRERLEDLPGLIDQLMTEHGSGRRFEELSDGDKAMLLSHRWPGNIRELRNAVERLLAFPDNPSASVLPESITQPSLPTPPGSGELLQLSIARERAQDSFERRYLRELVRRSEGSISEGARLAAVSRQYLQRLLRKHGMR